MTILFQILIAVVVFMAVGLLAWSLLRRAPVLEAPVQRRVADALGAGRPRTMFDLPATAALAGPALAAARRLDVPVLRRRVSQDLDASGNPQGYSVDEYVAVCLLCAVGAGTLSAVLGWALSGRFPLLLTTLMTAAGLAAPLWSLRSAAAARLRRIAKKLPYTLDLVALMMGAGATFTEAIETIVPDDPADDLNQELRIVQAEIDFGAKRATALSNMAARIPLETLRSVIGAVIQAERLGTPLSMILAAQAMMLRHQRSVRAEKLAASASLYILIPTMLVLFAAVLTLFGPEIVRWFTGGFALG